MNRIVPPDPVSIREAAELLRSGRLVAFPTETVYGLGANATDDAAVRGVYQAKGRPSHNPLIVHVPDVAAAAALVRFDERALRLGKRFWPGPLTLVLPASADAPISRYATAGLNTIAIRVPAHPVARTLLAEVALPIVAPSANPSGRISPTIARHVADDLGAAVAMVLDGGECPVGLESTVIDLSRPDRAVMLRPGGLPRAELEAVLGKLGQAGPDPDRPASPGMLSSHYAPLAAVRLDALTVSADEALLAFGNDVPAGACVTLNLSPSGDLQEAAANLFAMLRRADRSGAARIAVMPIPGDGLAEAIRDRLQRAAAPR
ncbi:MAG TPA: L-threonylcarbamoyladenylate synthase [Geminicoccus sp.]|uniref:L-threonylcarbamoyladenylate synthase n=1 Tax=Geminicoccus sp. TaxID=2024832 RepID=UPI002E31728D|nr:L-threonylcarbamoyladenylate synthase [Geminicoccus sp.]HEX2525510.1 L-threonylcarbamoyladenylate synthase [Geminicoccus sp.]